MIKRKDMLGLIDATAEEISEILDTAANMKKLLKQGIKNYPTSRAVRRPFSFMKTARARAPASSWRRSIWARARSTSPQAPPP